MFTQIFLALFLAFSSAPAPLEYGLCLKTCVSMRKTNDHKSEQVSQAIFGDGFKVLRTVGDWCEVELAYDNYKGWLPKADITQVSAKTYMAYLQDTWRVAVGKENSLTYKKTTVQVPAGATLPFLKDDKMEIEGKTYTFKGESVLPAALDHAAMLETAQKFLGVPYLWGGKSPAGWDCSGFVQMVGKMHGIRLLRDSYQQAEQGAQVSFKEAKAGDIAFFQRKSLAEGETRVIHVGLYMGAGRVIHADGVVRINTLDSTGIYRDDLQKYSHYLKYLRRH